MKKGILFKITFVILTLIMLGSITILGIKIYENKNTNIDKNSKIENGIEEVTQIREKELAMHEGNSFAKIEDIIVYQDRAYTDNLYIINIKDNNCKKISSDKVKLEKIYFDGEYIYGMPHHYSGKGIYKIDLEGNISKIFEGECVQLWLTDDKIYFTKQEGFDEINQTPQGNLCCMDKDGSNIKTIINGVKNYFKINNNKFYYTDWSSRALYMSDINGENKILLANGRTYLTGVTDSYLTYIDFSDGEKHRILYFDGNENHEIGRFGNCYITQKEGYIYTRKLIGNNNEIEDNFSLFKIDAENKTEKQINCYSVMGYLSYVYKNNAYIRENGINKVNLLDENLKSERTEFKSGEFLDGYFYSFTREGEGIKELVITNLDTLESKNILI